MSIVIEHLTHTYGDDTTLAVKALDDINLTIPDGQFVGITVLLPCNGRVQCVAYLAGYSIGRVFTPCSPVSLVFVEHIFLDIVEGELVTP